MHKYSNIHSTELPDDDVRCAYKVGIETLCGYERLPDSEFCADHDKMQRGQPLVQSTSLKTLQEYAQDVHGTNQRVKQEKVESSSTEMREMYGFTSAYDSVKKLRKYAKKIDPDLVDLLETHFTTMEWCSNMESHQVIQQYRMASSEIMRAIEKRRIEKGATDHISDLIEDLQKINVGDDDESA